MTEFHFESVSLWKRKKKIRSELEMRILFEFHINTIRYQKEILKKIESFIWVNVFDEHSWWQSKRRRRRRRPRRLHRNAITVIWNSMKKWKQELITFHKLLLSYVHISGWISVGLSVSLSAGSLVCICLFDFFYIYQMIPNHLIAIKLAWISRLSS